jgi:2'-5' RNA ligase
MPDAVKAATVPFAVWLLPEKKCAATLSEIISNLSRDNKTTPFNPHLTLISGSCSSVEQTKKILLHTVRSLSPVTLSVKKLHCSEEYFKTIFLHLSNSDDLEKYRKKMIAALPGNHSQHFLPHVSLLYSNMDLKDKKELLSSIKLSIKTILFDSASLVYPSNKLRGWYDITRWKIIFTEKLSLR